MYSIERVPIKEIPPIFLPLEDELKLNLMYGKEIWFGRTEDCEIQLLRKTPKTKQAQILSDLEGNLHLIFHGVQPQGLRVIRSGRLFGLVAGDPFQLLNEDIIVFTRHAANIECYKIDYSSNKNLLTTEEKKVSAPSTMKSKREDNMPKKKKKRL